MLKNQWNNIKSVIKKNKILFISIFIGYILINTLINQTYVTFPVLLEAKFFAIAFVFFTILVSLLVAATIVLVKVRISTLNKKGGAVGMARTFSGLVAGACPGCFVGLFPAVSGIFGLTATLSIFPLYGIEIQILSVLLLLFSIFYLSKDITCKIDLGPKKNKV